MPVDAGRKYKFLAVTKCKKVRLAGGKAARRQTVLPLSPPFFAFPLPFGIVADNCWLFLGGRQRLRPEDCGLRLWLGDFKWSRFSAQQPMSGRARPEHEPSTTAQPIALHNAKVVCRWVAPAPAAVVPECGPTRPGQMISAEIRDKTHAPRIALWRLRRFCLCFGFCLCLPCSSLPLSFFFVPTSAQWAKADSSKRISMLPAKLHTERQR